MPEQGVEDTCAAARPRLLDVVREVEETALVEPAGMLAAQGLFDRSTTWTISVELPLVVRGVS
ncbi:MAG TPA: hypothetical protein VKF40_27510 [Burkholderiales bacterium]|nr:hypothetical protein [Burkholderiales bacterium]